MKFEIFDIVWETDGEEVDLPYTVTVDADDEEGALSAASDLCGWLIKSYGHCEMLVDESRMEDR